MEQLDRARHIAGAASEATVDGQQAYLTVVETLLLELLGGDLVVWNGIETGTGRVMLAGSNAEQWSWLLPALADTIRENPLANRFLTEPGLAPPTRMSDVISRRTLTSGRLYAELWRPMGAEFQVGVPTSSNGTRSSRGWAINRGLRDFTASHLETLRMLQPALASLEDLVQIAAGAIDYVGTSGKPAPQRPGVRAEPTAPATARRARDVQAVLTAREVEVIDLVALGWTARHIGHKLRISTPTVRKHLEHIYAKLGAHDRLTAVMTARRARPTPDGVPTRFSGES